LGEGGGTTAPVEPAAERGRGGLMGLVPLLGSARSEAQRQSAGYALSVLWARDELIAEEEKALVRRGFEVRWRARMRYPRALRSEVPISVRFGVPFLREDGRGVRPTNLEWSYRVLGARRASLEVDSPWTPGPGRAEFTLWPPASETRGPPRLVLRARVRTAGLTGSWELELPHLPFTFEFDPRLATDALLALPDSARGEEIGRRVRLASRRV